MLQALTNISEEHVAFSRWLKRVGRGIDWILIYRVFTKEGRGPRATVFVQEIKPDVIKYERRAVELPSSGPRYSRSWEKEKKNCQKGINVCLVACVYNTHSTYS